jgi:hypothetical protein
MGAELDPPDRSVIGRYSLTLGKGGYPDEGRSRNPSYPGRWSIIMHGLLCDVKRYTYRRNGSAADSNKGFCQ